MRSILTLLFAVSFLFCSAQKKADFFKYGTNITYLGIDYSHAKFIGQFSQFADAGDIGIVSIKKTYFGGWNGVVYKEKDKYNFQDMLRKENISYSINAIAKINSLTAIDNMEATFAEEYSKEDIQNFIKPYQFKEKEGIGFMFLAEFLNKNTDLACFHFVALDMSNNKILIHKRYVENPGGFGLRNYWIRPIYDIIKKIKSKDYYRWKKSI